MEQRARGTPVRIEVDCSMQESTCHMLERKAGHQFPHAVSGSATRWAWPISWSSSLSTGPI